MANLRTRLKSDKDFETQLKDRVDKFISRSECRCTNRITAANKIYKSYAGSIVIVASASKFVNRSGTCIQTAYALYIGVSVQPSGQMRKWTIGTIIILLLTGILYYFFPEDKLPTDKKIDRLIVTKSKRTMDVYSGGQIIKTYTISLGRDPLGDKEFEGDKRTPEGQYRINDKNPNSGFHKNLGISYPNKKDIEEAKEKKLKPGGEIKIHGIRNGFGFIGKFQRLFDWTAGCIALTDQEVDELYISVEIGTPILILP